VSNRKKIKYVHEGQYVAEIEVNVIDSDESWAPYLSIEDAYKLDDAREALRHGNLEAASQYGKVFELRPIASA
jgi:hypothetical protein